MMTEVHIISTSTVKPATPLTSPEESTRRIELTPWDLQLLLIGPIQKGILFLKPTPQQGKEIGNTLIDHLKTSLSRTLDFFPPLAGRFASTKHEEDNTISFFINCNNAGAQFTHAVVNDLTVSNILKPVYVPRIVHSFFPLNGVLNHEGISMPLLAVQVTELVDGIFIGCTMNHSVADGTSFWQFFNSWSEISSGFNRISNPPVFQPWFPDNTHYPIQIPSFEEHLGNKFIQLGMQERVFHFSKENIAKLKTKANSEMGTDQISSLQALLAHLWRSVMRFHTHNTQETNFTIMVGARQRLRQYLVQGYFGNAVHFCTVKIKKDELLEQGLGYVAGKMNNMIGLQTHEEVRRAYENWVKNPKIFQMGGGTSIYLVAGSSPRFNVYGNDFGWGKPVAVRSGAANMSNGRVTPFPGVEEGSVDIEVCLSPETLKALGDDEEFMEAVSF